VKRHTLVVQKCVLVLSGQSDLVLVLNVCLSLYKRSETKKKKGILLFIEVFLPRSFHECPLSQSFGLLFYFSLIQDKILRMDGLTRLFTLR
jgi:hypothetical protein